LGGCFEGGEDTLEERDLFLGEEEEGFEFDFLGFDVGDEVG
jgi:hypothetical protein